MLVDMTIDGQHTRTPFPQQVVTEKVFITLIKCL